MSAIPDEFIKKTSALSDEVTRPFPNSRKLYVEGSRPDIRVPIREVEQTPTTTNGANEPNPPIYVYDTSGPYADPEVKIDLLKGLPDVRSAWIATCPSWNAMMSLCCAAASTFSMQQPNVC